MGWGVEVQYASGSQHTTDQMLCKGQEGESWLSLRQQERPSEVQAQGLLTPLPAQLPAHGLGKAKQDNPSAQVPRLLPPTWESRVKLFTETYSSPGHCDYWE